MGIGRQYLDQADFHLNIVLAERFVEKQVPNLTEIGIIFCIAREKQIQAELIFSSQETVLHVFRIDAVIAEFDDASDRPTWAKRRDFPVAEVWRIGCQGFDCREGVFDAAGTDYELSCAIHHGPKLECEVRVNLLELRRKRIEDRFAIALEMHQVVLMTDKPFPETTLVRHEMSRSRGLRTHYTIAQHAESRGRGGQAKPRNHISEAHSRYHRVNRVILGPMQNWTDRLGRAIGIAWVLRAILGVLLQYVFSIS
jgi:hypothetical protein